MTEEINTESAVAPGPGETVGAFDTAHGSVAGPDLATEAIDLLDPLLMRDPARAFSRVRERAALVRGVMPGVDPMWVATRYDDVRQVLCDPRFVADPAHVPGGEPSHRIEQLWRARGA